MTRTAIDVTSPPTMLQRLIDWTWSVNDWFAERFKSKGAASSAPGSLRSAQPVAKPVGEAPRPQPVQSSFPWILVVGALVVVAFALYNNAVTFDAGQDGCNYGPATATNCGIQRIGTAKGKGIGMIIGAPGHLLGRVVGGHSLEFEE